MDTSWIDLRPGNPTFYNGCMEFLVLAKETQIEGKTRCPCNKCKLSKWLPVNDVGGHILFHGFYKNYRNWIFHRVGEESNIHQSLGEQSNVIGRDDMEGLLKSMFRANNPHSIHEPIEDPFDESDFREDGLHNIDVESGVAHEDDDCDEFQYQNTNEEAKFRRLVDASQEALYEGCSTFSKLSFLLHLFHLKCLYHWSAESFTKLLELLIDAFFQIKEFPSSYYEAMKLINDLGLGYEKIHACPNDCMLYWGEFAQNNECHACHIHQDGKR